MQKLFKSTITAAFGAAIMISAPHAIAGEEQIVVAPSEAMAEWSADVTRSLNHRLQHTEALRRGTPVSSIVQLRFTLDENGRATDFTTHRSSGHRVTDRIAMRAVRGLDNLDQVPVSDTDGRVFQANIIFASDVFEHAKLASKLEQIERTRLARGGAEADVITLGG